MTKYYSNPVTWTAQSAVCRTCIKKGLRRRGRLLPLEELKVYVRNFKNRVVFIGENGAAMFFEHICCPENFASKYREKYLKNEIQPIVSVQNTQGEDLW